MQDTTKKFNLVPFEKSGEPNLKLEVQLNKSRSEEWELCYKVEGNLSAIEWPSVKNGTSSWLEGIWLKSCFSCFVLDVESGQYGEYVFSPSGDWCALFFDRYRARHEIQPVHWKPKSLGFAILKDTYAELRARFSLIDQQKHHIRGKVGLSAITHIKGKGTPIYWAINHAAEKPDFHHPDGMIAL